MIHRTFTAALLLTALLLGAAAYASDEARSLLNDPAGRMLDSFGVFRLLSHSANEHEIRFTYGWRENAQLDVVLSPRDDARDCYGRSRSFNVFSQQRAGHVDDAEAAALLDEALKRLALNDQGNIRLERAAVLDAERMLSAHLKVSEKKDFVFYYLYALCSLLIVVVLALLPRLVITLHRHFAQLDFTERYLLYAAFAIGAALRIAAPYRLVQLYSGYTLVSDALWFNHVPRYGAGWYVFFNHLFRLLPGDHLSVIWVNVVFSTLALPLLAYLAQRIFNYRLVASLTVLLAALHPLFVKDAISESMFPLTLFWLLAGLAFASLWIESRRRVDLAAACAFLTLAMLSRPLLAVYPLAAALLLLPQPGFAAALKERYKDLLIIGMAAYALCIPNFMHLIGVSVNNPFPYAPRLVESLSESYLAFFTSFNLLWNPQFTPFLLWMLLAVGLYFLIIRRRRYGAFGPLAASVLLFTIYLTDQPPPSMPRLQAPSQMLLLPIIAAGLALALQQTAGYKPRMRKALLCVLLLTAVVALPPPYIHLWRGDNSSEEEAFISESLPLLPDKPFVLVRRAMSDEPHDFIDCAFPDYRVVPPRAPGIVLGIEEFFSLYDSGSLTPASMPGGIYFYAGMRCYAQHRDKQQEYALWSVHPDCDEMYRRLPLEAVLEKDAENHRESYHRYPAEDRLRVGLYRIK